MLLSLVWVVEASVGLVGAVLVLVDSLAIRDGITVLDAGAGKRYGVEITRDWIIVALQAVNVAIGAVAALITDSMVVQVREALGNATILGLMAGPALLGVISWTTYRARRR